MKKYIVPLIKIISIESEDILQSSDNHPGLYWSEKDLKWYYSDPYADDDWDKGSWRKDW